MRITLTFLTIALVSLFKIDAQPSQYTVANAHSHNDYEQLQPFFLAYQEGFGSIEADIHLKEGKLLVAHDAKNLIEDRSLDKLYLDPIADGLKKNQGNPYSDANKTLQLLIDIKTDANPTIQALVALLKKYPTIIQNKKSSSLSPVTGRILLTIIIILPLSGLMEGPLKLILRKRLQKFL